jgi:general secretion pathway protein N
MKRLIIAGLLFFLVVLLVTFPARVAYQWLAPAEVKLSGITGSIWNGKAAEGIAAGAYVRNIDWTIQPGSLFKGQLAFFASADPGSGAMTATIAAKSDGSLIISDLDGSVPLDLVHQAFQQSGIRGDVVLEFAKLVIRDGLPVEADGSVTINDFFAPVLSAATIGDFRAVFQTSTDGITGVVNQLSGVINVEGTIDLMTNRSYLFIGQVSPTPETPPSITNQLVFLGSPNDRGQRSFRFEGQL